jgi:hypothetical protein
MTTRTGLIIGAAAGVAATLVIRAWRHHQDNMQPGIRTSDPVELASDDSFPASDPPSYTATTGTVTSG